MPEKRDDEQPQGDLSGPYARDTHRDGLSDDYARDGGWSGAGRADDHVPDREHWDRPDDEPGEHIGKASE